MTRRDLPHLMNSLSYVPSDDRIPQALREAAAEIERLRAIVRVNGLRWGHTHAEVDAILQEQRHACYVRSVCATYFHPEDAVAMSEPGTTDTIAAMRQHPDADEGARAWAMGAPYGEGRMFHGDARVRWEWGWRDAESGYRAQFKEI